MGCAHPDQFHLFGGVVCAGGAAGQQVAAADRVTNERQPLKLGVEPGVNELVSRKGADHGFPTPMPERFPDDVG